VGDTINRSMVGELAEGMIDGSRKKPEPNRGGAVEDATRAAREDLASDLYDYEDNEWQSRTELPDATTWKNR